MITAANFFELLRERVPDEFTDWENSRLYSHGFYENNYWITMRLDRPPMSFRLMIFDETERGCGSDCFAHITGHFFNDERQYEYSDMGWVVEPSQADLMKYLLRV